MNPRTLLLVGVTFCTSCATLNRNVYRANPINLPGLTEKGESRISASLGGNVELARASALGGADLQAAYAVSRRITLLGGYSGRCGTDQGNNDIEGRYLLGGPYHSDTAHLQYRNNTWELGAAYIIRFGRHVYMSLSAGGGTGNFRLDDRGAYRDSAYRCFLDAHQGSLFVQPAMYFKLKGVELGVGFKFSETHYTRVRTNYPDSLQVSFVVNDLDRKNMWMWQPFWVLRIRPHLSWLQIEVQGNVNVGWNSTPTMAATTYYFYYLNGGVGVSIDPDRLLGALKRR